MISLLLGNWQYVVIVVLLAFLLGLVSLLAFYRSIITRGKAKLADVRTELSELIIINNRYEKEKERMLKAYSKAMIRNKTITVDLRNTEKDIEEAIKDHEKNASFNRIVDIFNGIYSNRLSDKDD